MLPRDEETSKLLIDGIVNQYGRKEVFSIYKKLLQMDSSSSHSWTLTRINTLPVQNNDHDCGAFVCMFLSSCKELQNEQLPNLTGESERIKHWNNIERGLHTAFWSRG